MNKVMILLALLLTFTAASASAQKKDAIGNFLIGNWNDSVKSNTTKIQKIAVGTPSNGITVQYFLDQVTDTITGVVSVWCSLDDSTYTPYPGADSVTISAATDVRKMWFLNTKAAGNGVRYIAIHTRCPSNTTNSTSKARLRTKLWGY